MPKGGLQPPLPQRELTPQASVSANSTTSARDLFLLGRDGGGGLLGVGLLFGLGRRLRGPGLILGLGRRRNGCLGGRPGGFLAADDGRILEARHGPPGRSSPDQKS